MIREPSHPKGQTSEIGIGTSIPGALASRGMKINPWIRHPRAAATVTKTDSDWQLLTAEGIRKPTVAEAAMLGSFPPAYRWLNQARQRIGNSVPPLFMRAIARHLRNMPPAPLTPAASSYRAALDAAWAEHLAPRSPAAPTVISTFAGCGGSSLGYSMAGFRELLAVEWDQNAADTFRLNFPDVPLYHGDIARLSVEDTLRRTGLKPGELDVFDGSPPCQGFSTAGKRDFGDGRNQLFREYVRLLRGLQPKVFVMENVSGMVKGGMKLIFAEILRELKASGYAVKARLLNAMFFDVPQSRERMIFVGVRLDRMVEPSHPRGSAKVVTAGDAIEGADVTPLGQPTASIRAIAHKIKPGKDAGDYTPSGTGFSVVRLNPARPSNTITKHMAGMSGLLQPLGCGYLSASQIKRLGSFPDEFKLTGKPAEQWARIGNSVPPFLMRAVSSHIAKNILLATP